jgi:hypothetical protein
MRPPSIKLSIFPKDINIDGNVFIIRHTIDVIIIVYKIIYSYNI